MIELFFKLLCGHALADFALQSRDMAKMKSWNNKPDYIPEGQKPNLIWPYVLSAHSLIHGLCAYIATGNYIIGIVETVLHFIIDCFKIGGKIGVHVDQLLHILCKGVYVCVLLS